MGHDPNLSTAASAIASGGIPAFSIAMPTYKRLDLLSRAVRSVLAQTFADWELVISDDEDPPGAAWEYLQKLAASEPRVRILRNTLGPHGQCGNVNNALRNCRAEWIKILYDDDAMRPECLEKFRAAIAGADSVVMVSCLADHYVNNVRVRSDPRGKRPRLEILPRTYILLSMYLQDVDVGIPTQVMVRRSIIDGGVLFEDVPGFVSGVDSWWFTRVLQHGDLLFLNELLVEQHQGEHESVTSAARAEALDSEMQQYRRMVFPMIDPALHPPSLTVANQMLILIRAMHRLSRRKPLEAIRLAAHAWHPRAWWLAGRWFLRRSFPGRFEAMPRIALEE